MKRRSLGFTLVGVAVLIAIITILIAAVGPSVYALMQRDREEELIFRGKQYARAILLFQRRYGRYPISLQELHKSRPRTIRKLWDDPMCDCDDWHLLIAGQPDAGPIGKPGGPPTTPPPGGGGGNRPPSTYGGLFPPTPVPQIPPTPTPRSIFGSDNQTVNVGPIVGVRSKVHKEGFRDWRGLKFYDEWRFIAGDADGSDQPQTFDPWSLRQRTATPGSK